MVDTTLAIFNNQAPDYIDMDQSDEAADIYFYNAQTLIMLRE